MATRIIPPTTFGPQGSVGPQGAFGPQGSAGPQGPLGLTGATGPQGSIGPQGAQGTQGAQGALGPTGPTGPQGTQGVAGPQGTQGTQGVVGPIGPTGPAGAGSGDVISDVAVSVNSQVALYNATTGKHITPSALTAAVAKIASGVMSAATAGTDYLSPAGTETVTNKTIDATNTITAKDSTFTVVDDVDATKKIAFQASGITTGTTRTVTVPDASGTATLLGNASTGSGSVVLASSPAIVTPTIASFVNANHGHTNAAGGGTLAEAALALTDITTNNVVSTRHGLAPKSPADATQFLNGATTPAYAAVKDSDLSTSDITTNNVSITKHGFAPKGSNVATQYLDGTGAWSTPAGSGGGSTSGTMILTDEFIGGGTSSGGIGQLQWLSSASGGTLTSFSGSSAIAGHPGYIRLNSGATSTNYAVIYLDAINVNDIDTVSFIFQGIDSTLVRHYIGMANSINTAPTTGILLEFDTSSADTNWMVNCIGGSTSGRTSTGVAFAAGSWVQADFTRTASNTWTVAATRLDTSATGNVTGKNYAAGLNNNIQFCVKTAAAAAKQSYIDWFRLSLNGLIRT